MKLRIHFEVDEKHVGACLIALEGKARNLNYEIVEELGFEKNRKKSDLDKPKPGALKQAVIARIRGAGENGMPPDELGQALREQEGFSLRAIGSGLTALKRHKIIKMRNGNYILGAKANG